MGIEYRILGPIEVRIDGVAVSSGGPRQRALLAMLLLSANQVVSRDRLINELLPDAPADSADSTLRVQVSRLRKVLDGDGPDPTRLVARAPGYMLRVEPGMLDLERFETLVAEGRRQAQDGDLERAAELFREAEALWRGRPLADLEFEPFARIEVERLQESRLETAEQRVEVELDLGRHARLVAELESRVAEYPLRERVRAQLMLALYRCGRQAEALEVYRTGRTLMNDELGLEPGPALRALEASILRQDPGLELDGIRGIAVATRVVTAPAGRGTDVSQDEDERGTGVPEREGPLVRAFLVADIRGFSSFSAARGDEATAALTSRFADVARRALRPHGGDVIRLAGDEVIAVYDSPRAAVRAALALQAALLDATREDSSLPMPVGVGLDFGEAIHSPDGWSAHAITVASRLCSVARGGEILATEQLMHVAHTLDGVSYQSRDPVTLKGLGRPVRHVRVVSDTLDVERELNELGMARAAPIPDAPRGRAPRLAITAAVVVAVAVAAVVLAVATDSGHGSSRISGNEVNELSTDGGVVRRVLVGAAPGAVAAAGDTVWVANTADNTVSRIEATNAQVPVNTIPVGHLPSAVSIGFGSVWVANSEDRSISRIDLGGSPTVGDTIHVGNGPSAITSGFGRVWVANGVDETVSVLDPGHDRVINTIPVGTGPDALTAAFGAVWVANQGASSVSRIDPTTGAVIATISVGNGPAALVATAQGIWVANTLDDTVSLISPDSNRVSATVEVGAKPAGLTTTGDRVWVMNNGSGSISEINARTASLVRTLRVGAAPRSAATTSGGVWVSAGGSAASHRGGTFRIVQSVGLPSLDPAVAYSNLSASLLAVTNDGLVTYRRSPGPAGGEIVPDLAAELPGETPDGRTYTFQLRHRLRYSTGAPVRASDFRASMERVFRVHEAPPYYGGIVGASACAAAPARCNLSKGIVTDDKTGTITVHLTQPDPEFLYKLALPFADVLPARTPAHDLGLSAHPSTGPYAVRGRRGGQILLARNPRFRVWSPAAQPPGYPDRITVAAASGSGERAIDRDYLAVAAGRYDWTPDAAPPGLVARLVHDDATQMHPYTVNTVRYFFLNTSVPPFNDIRVRRAVNLAVDRRAAVDAFGGPFLATPTCQSEAPSLFGYTPYCPYTVHPTASGRWTAPDLSAARTLIRQAHAEGDRVAVFTAHEYPAPGALLARTMRAIGLRATLHVYPRPGDAYYYYVGNRANRVQAGLEGWNVDYPEPSNLFTVLLRCSSRTPVRNLDESEFCDRGIDQEMDAALRLQVADPASARLLWARIDREITDRAPWVPLTNDRLYDVVSRRVGNYEHHPQFGMLIDQAWVQ